MVCVEWSCILMLTLTLILSSLPPSSALPRHDSRTLPLRRVRDSWVINSQNYLSVLSSAARFPGKSRTPEKNLLQLFLSIFFQSGGLWRRREKRENRKRRRRKKKRRRRRRKRRRRRRRRRIRSNFPLMILPSTSTLVAFLLRSLIILHKLCPISIFPLHPAEGYRA